MGEILLEDLTTVEADYQSDNTGDLVGESLDARKAELDRVLTSLVSANANTVVKCPWLAGAEVTLSDAMKAYPKPMIEEDPYVLAQIVMEMLANPVTDSEENSEQDEEEAEVIEEEVAEQRNAEDAKRTTTKKDVNKPERIAEPKAQENPKSPATGSKQQPKKGHNNQELSNNELEITPPPQDVSAVAAETQNHAKDQARKNPPETINADIDNKDGPPRLEIADRIESMHEHLVEEGLPPAEVETVSESSEPPLLEAENTFGDTETQDVDEDPTSDGPSYRIDIDRSEYLLEEKASGEQLLDELEPSESLIDFGVGEFDEDSPDFINELMLEPSNTLDQPKAAATFENEFIDEPDEVEDLLTQLSNRIEQAEPEVAAIANGLLDKIDQTADLLVVAGDGNVINEQEIRDEISKLFSELFEELEIPYTVELIETMTKLVIISQLTEEISAVGNEESDDTPKDDGTHEVIKNILASRNRVQKTRYYANTIGKSALMLYNNAVLVDGWLAASG